jgi:hypothetical protein
MATRVVMDASGLGHLDLLLERITRNAVDDIADDARRRCPVDTGELVESIDGHMVGPRHGRVSVGTDHWHPTEYGSGPHLIRVRDAKVLANRETGEFFGTVVHHPGTPEQPFMRPAAYTKRRPRTTP